MALTQSQQMALNHINEYAKKRSEAAQGSISHILEMSNLTNNQFKEALTKIKNHARVALHFHPDRPDTNNLSVAEALLETGVYKNQFVTKLSNGSVSATDGGERDEWEKTVFAGSYHIKSTTSEERPKYGALNLMLHPDGPSPRFGSCYFLLKPAASQRCTFTYMDSHTNPEEKGSIEEFTDIFAALLTEVFTRDFALGEHNVTPTKLFKHILQNMEKPIANPKRQQNSRNLNHYIEAQVHGDISIQNDVETLVADPSFRYSSTGDRLHELAKKFEIGIYWHQGFQLAASDTPSDFRGPYMPSLANKISEGGFIDARLIGKAAMSLKKNPLGWADHGDYHTVLQKFKLLWHVLVKYGNPHTAIKK